MSGESDGGGQREARLRAVPRKAPVRRGRLRRAGRVLTRRRGWFGFAVGVVAGATAGALVAVLLPAALAPATGLESGELVILSGKDDSAGGQRRALLDQWNALHPDSPARIEELPSQADAQHSEMVARAQSGSHPVDIYNLDVTSVAEFAHAGYLRPVRVTDADTEGFLAAPLATCRYAGKLWGLPFNSDAGLLFYRSDLVRVPPTTLTAVTDDIAAVLSRSGHDPRLVAGYTGQLADYEGLTVNALEAIWAAGGDVVDGEGHVVIDSPQTRAGLRWLATGLAAGNPQPILRQSASFDESQSTSAFYDHQVLFLRNWPVAYRTLQAPPATGRPAGTGPPPFDVSRLPGPSVLGGQDLAIARGSPRPRAAQALIEFLTSERSQQILFERGGFAATREIVYHDATVVDRYRYAPVLLDALRAARPRPVTPHYPRFTEVFRGIVRSALRNGGQLPVDATRALADALRGY
ncbi:MAG: multiple sugar transport system substrate-binding protein [Micromonosporaceae bacterium]